MKKYLTLYFILFTILEIQKVYSQEYAPVVSAGNISSWNLPFITMASVHTDSIYSIEIENGYFELWYRGKYLETPEYQGKIRSDESHTLLYWVAPDAEEEKLIMNLNLEIGDEFEFTDLYGRPFAATVDAIYEEYGLKHIQFDYDLGTTSIGQDLYSPKLTFIEGVGPNWGFCCQVTPYFFICKHNNQELFYALETLYIKDCRIVTPWGINNFNTESLITIYPNPANNEITISSNNNSLLTNITIMNFLGQTVCEYVPNRNSINLNVSNLQQGVYFIKSISNNNNNVILKFIKL